MNIIIVLCMILILCISFIISTVIFYNEYKINARMSCENKVSIFSLFIDNFVSIFFTGIVISIPFFILIYVIAI